MGWQEDLDEFLGEISPGNVAGGVVGAGVATADRYNQSAAGQNPLSQALFGGLGLGAHAAMDIMGAPASAVAGGVGELHSLAQGQGLIPFPEAQAYTGQRLHSIQEQDFGPFGFAKTPVELAANLVLDPTTYLGFGLGTKVARGAGVLARTAMEAERPFMAAGLRGVEQGAKAAQFVWNDAPEIGARRLFGSAPMQAVKTKGRGGVERVFPGAFDLAPEDAHNLERAAWTNAWQREQQAAGGPPQPTVPPLTGPSGPPLVPHPHPPGSAPARIYDKGVGAWVQQWIGRGKEPGRLGIVFNSSEHGLPSRIADFTDRDLESLATLSVRDMQIISDETHLFGRVRRSVVDAPQWRDEMIAQYGDNIVPTLPAIWNRMRQKRPELHLPDARFVMPQGYAFKSVPTRRLDLTQERWKAGDLTRTEALAQIQNFPMGSPEAVEAAASHGVGILSAFRTGGDMAAFRPGGAYFPTPEQLTPELGGAANRAAAPEAFYQETLGGGAPGEGLVPHDLRAGVANLLEPGGQAVPFGTNRAAWEAYIQEQLGPMPADELDTLARMSVDQLYNEYVNAANDYALGATAYAGGAAERIAAAKAAAEAAGTRFTYRREAGKVGTGATRPTQRAGTLGQQLLSANVKIGKHLPGGQISEKAGWMEQLRQVLGENRAITRDDLNLILGETKGSREFSGEEVKRALTALEQTPLEANTTGGLMPNLQEVLDAFEIGKDLSIRKARYGATPADKLFDRAAREMAMVIGTGNPDDAKMLMHFAALTSSATNVERNMKIALRALAEWKYGQDETLLKQFGIRGPDLDAIVTSGALREGLRDEQEQAVSGLLSRARAGRDTSPLDIEGAKIGNLAMSFLAPFWRRQLDEHATALVGKLSAAKVREVREAFDRAMIAYAPDRHISRFENGPTALSALQQLVSRERGAIAARAAGVPAEEMQAALWYVSRDLQGTVRLHGPETDFAGAIRKVIGQMWDDNRLPDEQSWETLVNAARARTGLEGEDLYTEIYNTSKQDIFYRILADAFREPKVAEALKAAHLPATLSEMSRDMMGIAARGAHGLYPDEWPNPMSGSAVDSLAQTVEANAGLADPVMLQFKDGGWAPISGGGYAVPVMPGGSYGIGQTQTARKTLEKLITKPIVADVFDPSLGDRTSHLAIGVVPSERGQSLGLYALTTDQATAEVLARRAGAKHLYDIASGQLIPGPGGRRAASLPALLEESLGPATQLPRPSLNDAWRQGVTLGEQDTRNPVSLLMSRVVNPIMDRYNALTEDGVANIAARTMDDLDVPDWGSEDGGLTRRGYNAAISAPDNAMLLKTTQDGDTYRTVIAQYRDEGAEAQKILADAGAHWDPYASLDARKAAVNQDPDLVKVIAKWHERGVDPLYARTPDDIGLTMLDRIVRKEKGLKATARSTVPALLKASWQELVLATPKYLTGNIAGNVLNSALVGGPMALSPKEFAAALKVIRNGADEITRAEAMESLKSTQIMRFWGLPGIPEESMRGGIREMRSNAARYSASPTGELVGRVLGERVGRAVGTPLIYLQDLSQAEEVVARNGLTADFFDRNMWGMIDVWEAEVRKAGSAIPGFEFSIRDHINTPQGGLHTEAIRDKLIELSIPDGKATRLIRDFSNIRHKALADATKTMQRALFTYDRTNFDNFIANFVPFHYWASRAMRFYFEESLRHPFLIVNYMRAQDGIEDAENNPGLSARQKGFLKMLGTPLGFSLLMNPDALLGVAKVFNLDDSYEADGQTSMGGILSFLKDRGFGLYPWIDGTMNLMGIYGNTFEPDLLGIRHKALVGAAINFARAHTGFDPAGTPYADAMGQLRYSVSSFVDSFSPDWLAQTVTPRAGGSSQEASLDITIESIVLQQNPQLTNQQLLDIMSDPESPEYQHAFQMASDAGLVQQLLNISLPVNFRMRHDARDVRLAQMNTIYEAAQATGQKPYEFAPTPYDLAFRAKYKNLTGSEWKPGDYETAKLRNDLTRAPLAAKQFILDEALYNDLGTPKQQKAYDRYYAIVYGTDPLTRGNPDEASRRATADWWADTHQHAARRVEEMYAVRDTYASTHPEFQEFKDWQGRVNNLAATYGGLGEYRRQVSQASPNAARYFAQQEAWLQATIPQARWEEERDRYTTSSAAFHAITGRGTASNTSAGGAPSRQEQGPYPGALTADVTLPLMEPAPPAPQQTGPYPEDWARQAANMNYGIRSKGYTY